MCESRNYTTFMLVSTSASTVWASRGQCSANTSPGSDSPTQIDRPFEGGTQCSKVTNAKKSKQFISKCTGENVVTVGDNSMRKLVKFNYFIKDNSCHCLRSEGMLLCYEVCIFSVSIHRHQDRIVTFRGW
jgi:hypothetical protein